MVVRLAFFMSENTKNPEWNITMSRICHNIHSRHVQFTDQKKTFKEWPKVKIHLLKYATTKYTPIWTLPKNLRWSEMRYIICRPELNYLKTRKNLKMYIIVRIGLSINENTKGTQI